MFNDESELRVLRERVAELEALLDERPPGGAAGGCVVCVTTVIGSYPTTAQAYYAVQPQDAGGTEAEGETGELTAAGDGSPDNVFFAFNIGTGLPPRGSPQIVEEVGGRWVFQHDG